MLDKSCNKKSLMNVRVLLISSSIYCVLFLSLIAAAQSKKSSSDNLARTLLTQSFNSTNELSNALTQSFSDDSEKVRSIFIFITHAIEYDVNKRVFFARINNDTTQTATYTLRKRKAVCEGYANLFKELCLNAGIKSEFIGGYARNEGEYISYPHAWNTAFINGEWKLFDPTWAAGGVNSQTKKFTRKYDDAYFMISPQKLIKTHYPDDPMWQLMAKPVTRDLFEKKSTALETSFNFKDTISAHYSLDSNSRTINELSRMISFDPDNDIFRQQLNQFNENTEVDKMNKANELSQSGIDLLNDCAHFINDAKRKRNTKIMNENEKFLLDHINLSEQKIKDAIELYKQCKPSLPQNKMTVQNNINTMKQNLDAIDNNRKYLLNYYATPKSFRIKVL